MFVTPCVITMMLNKNYINSNINKINSIFWSGNINEFHDDVFNIHRTRINIYNKIKDHIDTYNNLDYSSFIEKIKEYKICLDLQGNGDPNKRTFEILSSGTLLFTNIIDLNWGFEEGDSFSEETIFYNETDFLEKKQKLLNEQTVYNKCLANQKYLVDKYFSKESMRNRILNKL
jgi:spore maturation protein CgeB